MNEVIAEIQVKPQQRLRITLSTFRGGTFLDLRTVYDISETEHQNWVLTKRGVNFPIELLSELISSLELAAKKLDLE